MAQEKLTPQHPDWVWLQSPLDELTKERSAPFDAKVSWGARASKISHLFGKYKLREITSRKEEGPLQPFLPQLRKLDPLEELGPLEEFGPLEGLGPLEKLGPLGKLGPLIQPSSRA
jgi:hypothetical protein